MIVTQFYRGQGLGNQLWVYATCRSIALNLGVDFGIQAPENFKGKPFLSLDFGTPVRGKKFSSPSMDLPEGISHYFRETKVLHPNGRTDVSPFDEKITAIRPRTKIDGNFQSERYVENYRTEISMWFRSSFSVALDDDTCVISFRGGEYRSIPEVLLPSSYYRHAMEYVRNINPRVTFLVVTDDPYLAKKYFPELQVVSQRLFPPIRGKTTKTSASKIGKDFTFLQRAKYLILSNSSFSWWGAWTNDGDPTVVAPKYWARFNSNDGYWSMGGSLTKGWIWIDVDGRTWTYQECLEELQTASQ